MKECKEKNELNEEIKLIIFKLIEGIISKNRFNGYPEYIKSDMTLYGYELFNRYWKNFELYEIKNGKKINKNPYSYFYKMIIRSYFNILKNYDNNNYFNFYNFPNEDLEFFNNNNNNYDLNKEKDISYKELKYKFNDVIYDINIISYSILNQINLISDNITIFDNYYFNKEIYKILKNDKSFNEILKFF